MATGEELIDRILPEAGTDNDDTEPVAVNPEEGGTVDPRSLSDSLENGQPARVSQDHQRPGRLYGDSLEHWNRSAWLLRSLPHFEPDERCEGGESHEPRLHSGGVRTHLPRDRLPGAAAAGNVRSVGLRVTFRTAMRNILVGEFFARVTPFAAGGGEPAQIYMLFKDDSINMADSTMVFAIKAILAGASQVVVLTFVPVWLFFSGRSLEVGNRFRLILFIGIAAYVANFAILVFCLVRLQQISDYMDRLIQRPAETLNGRRSSGSGWYGGWRSS